MIPLSIPNFEGNENKYVSEAVAQGWVSTGGAYVSKFEVMLSEFVGAKSAAACQSGTAALHLSLIDAGVTIGDLVIAPSLTFIAAINPIRYCGADPVFMDCDDSLCMDPDKLSEFCQSECQINQSGELVHNVSNRVIRAIIVVHVFGNMADMEKIMAIAAKYNLKVIEDATEALGTKYLLGEYKDKCAGTIGDYGAYSFNGNKIITTGGGGMVVARDESSVDHIKYLSTQAKDDLAFYIHNEIGYNYRMTNVQAAIGVAQMEELPEFIRRKNCNYELYKEKLHGIKGKLLEFRDDVYSNKWFYSYVIDSEKAIVAKEFVENLKKLGVETRCIWGLINEQLPYRECISYKIEKAKFYESRVINLPCSTNIREEDIDVVCESIRNLVK